MTSATIVIGFVADAGVFIAYDDSPPIVPDQSHAAPRLNRQATAATVVRSAIAEPIDREAAAPSVRRATRAPGLNREARE